MTGNERIPGRVAVVTGANQGLGLALTTGLVENMEPQETVYLTGRNAGNVAIAGRTFEARGLHVVAEQLDVTDPPSVARFTNLIRRVHGGVDIVFSNAAARITPNEPSRSQVRQFIATNNLGTTRVLRSFVPMLREHGRLFVVASSFGTLRSLPIDLHDRFDNPSLSLDALDEVMATYVVDVELGRNTAGWPEWINIPSKVGQVAAARVAAREARDGRTDLLIAAVCPGLVYTDASRPWFDNMTDAQTPQGAANHLIPLALREKRLDIHGELVQFGRVLPWR